MPRKAIEALGVRERNVEWEVTLCTAADRNCLLQLPAIAVKGHQVQVGGVRKSARRLRVFYLPYYVPITAITSQLVQKGVKVIKTFQEKDRETGLASNVWNVLVAVDSEDEVPDRMRWSFAGMQGASWSTWLAGRRSVCAASSVDTSSSTARRRTATSAARSGTSSRTCRILSGIQREAQTVLGVYLKCTCSRVTSASSALGVLNDYALYIR